MQITILLPHFRTGKMTAYAVSQLVKFKGKHDVKIIVIDNSTGDSSIDHILLTNLRHHCTVIHYPPGLLQSHGVAFDFVLRQGLVETEYFLTVESDSFPTEDNWLDYYENLIKEGYHAAGSLLQLSGGIFLHPCGTLYRVQDWREMDSTYCKWVSEQYTYFPNMAMREGFPCHLMVRRDFLPEFMQDPSKHVELHHSYAGLLAPQLIEKAAEYEPTCHPFHFGMGSSQETFNTYRLRTIESEAKRLFFDGTQTLYEQPQLIYRMGSEPGQLFSSWLLATGRNIKYIPTEVKWLPNRINQQQEYTRMDNGFQHEWAVTAYNGCEVPELQDIVQFKQNRMNELYLSLPENQKL